MGRKAEVRYAKLEIAALRPSESNVRSQVDPREMEALGASMEAVGLLVPLVVRACEDGYEVVAGCRRLAAAKSLGWEKLACVVVAGGGVPAELVSMHENLNREPLNEWDVIQAVGVLVEGLSGDTTAAGKALGRSEAWVAQRVRARLWHEGLLAHLVAGSLTFTQCRTLSRLGQASVVEDLARQAAEGGASVRTLEGWVNEQLVRVPGENVEHALSAEVLGTEAMAAGPVECGLCGRDIMKETAEVVYLCEVCDRAVKDESKAAQEQAKATGGEAGLRL